MQHKKIEASLEHFLGRARRKERRHCRSFRLAGSLAGCVVPLVVLASGTTPGWGSLFGFAIVANVAWLLFRHLGRGRSERLYDELAQELAGKFPEESVAYQKLLHCLITTKPRKRLVEELIRRMPGAEHLDVMTGGGAVTFGKIKEPKAAAPSSAAPKAKDPQLQELMEKLTKEAMPTQESLSAFLKQHPNAKTIVTKQQNGAGSSVHSVQVFNSSSSGAPKPPATATPTPETPPPEPVAPRRPDFIPLSPCEPGKN